eukprot:TRINITY_DN59_c0_g1_i1.p1 TRINITY_DN59_c0_g1~~TRINITY_DN59_c0_g1_i1.p1  ORF type:complete len:136 (-),score=46.16 TRINITY_DN59_c0_g1_i1:134-541(-)
MANQWSTYCQNNICRAGGCSSAGIYDASSGAAWGTTTGFKATPEQIKGFNAAFASDAGVSALQAGGIKVGDTKYMFLQIDKSKPPTILGKTKDGGCVIQKSSKAIVVGVYGSGSTPGESNKQVTQFTDWLINSNY